MEQQHQVNNRASILITKTLHEELKRYAKKNGLVINRFVERVIKAELTKQKVEGKNN